MFFRKKKKKDVKQSNSTEDNLPPSVVALRKTINEQSKTNPLLRAQITGKDISTNLVEWIKDEKGIRIETALGILGSLAGFSTVYAMVKKIEDKSLPIQMPDVAIAEMKDGRKLYMGDYINRRVFQYQTSIFSLTAGVAQHLGAKDITNFEPYLEVLKKQIELFGKPEFGIPNLPSEHSVGDLPINYVKYLFPKFLPILERYELPVDEFHAAFGFSIQELMQQAKGVVDPKLALNIVMECAIPMSKVDPNEVISKGF